MKTHLCTVNFLEYETTYKGRKTQKQKAKPSIYWGKKKYIEKHDKGENLNIGYIPL